MKNNISFVIPAYNSEDYITETLQSIAAQTDKNYEIVVVDNGSQDHTNQCIQDFQNNHSDMKITLITLESNQGIAAARNRGLKHASGDYVHFFDSDDLLEENFVASLRQAIAQERSDVIVFGYHSFDKNGLLKSYLPCENLAWAKWGLCFVWSTAIRREFLIENQLFYQEGIYNEDRVFALRMAQKVKKLSLLPLFLYRYRVHSSSTSHRFHDCCEKVPYSREVVYQVLKEALGNSSDTQEDLYIKYYAVYFTYTLMLSAFRKNPINVLLFEAKEYRRYLKMYFPDYKKDKFSLSFPEGERFIVRAGVFCSYWADKFGLYSLFLRIIHWL